MLLIRKRNICNNFTMANYDIYKACYRNIDLDITLFSGKKLYYNPLRVVLHIFILVLAVEV